MEGMLLSILVFSFSNKVLRILGINNIDNYMYFLILLNILHNNLEIYIYIFIIIAKLCTGTVQLLIVRLDFILLAHDNSEMSNLNKVVSSISV